MKEEDPVHSPQRVSGFRTLAILLGFCAMASGGKGCYAAEAASSSPGGGPAAGWKAADSLRMIAAQRAHQWRESEGVLDNNDFACAYTDNDQVVGLAGHHVADDWFQTRTWVEEELLAAGAKVVEDNPKSSVVLRPVRETINVDKNISEDQGPGVHVPGYGLLQACRHRHGHAQGRVEADLSKGCREEGAGQPGGDHHVLLEAHGPYVGAAVGVPTRGDGRIGGLAKQRKSARSWPDGLPLLVSQICSFHQDQVFGVGSRIQVDEPAFLGGDPKRGAGRGS